MTLFCCKAAPKQNLKAYQKAVKHTASLPLADANSEVGEKGIERFIAFYTNFNAAAVTASVRNVYAPNAFFADPFHTVEGIDAVEAYFVRSTETFNSCLFTIDNVASQGPEVYMRWTMHLVTKRNPDEVIEAIGMTHFRMDSEGRVVFHQDYWDPAGTIYEKLPIIGRTLRWIRAKI